MTRAKADVDASRCPLCGEANGCAIERERETGQAQGPCWCMQAGVSAEALALVPPDARGLACICGRCAMSEVAAERERQQVMRPGPGSACAVPKSLRG